MRLLYGLLCVLWLAGCSSAPINSEMAESASATPAGRQIHQSASLTLAVDHVDESSAALQHYVSVAGGYVKNQRLEAEESATLVCEVPQSNMTGFLVQARALGKVLNERQAAEDITNNVVSVDVELKNLVQLRERLLKVLHQAQKIKDILEVEQELKRVETRIDYLEKQKKLQAQQVRYSEIAIELQKPRVLGPLGMLFHGVAWTIEKLFVIQ